MAISSVSICSNALAKLGDDPITSLSDPTHRAKKCLQKYDPSRKAVLRDHVWHDSRKREQLAQLVEAPEWEYTYAYQLPHDYIRMVKTSLGRYDNYTIEGNKLLCNVNEIYIVYIYDNADVTTYDALHVEALETKLAFELALSIAGKASYRDGMAQEYMSKLRDAKAVNGQETDEEILDSGSDLIDVR